MNINDICLCWNTTTRKIDVLPWPLGEAFRAGGFTDDFGASLAAYDKLKTHDKAVALLTEAMWLVANRGIPFLSAWDAIRKVDEVRKLLDVDPLMANP